MVEGQLDMFGGVTSLDKLPKPQGNRKYKTMQELHGKLEGKTCKSCNHCIKYRYHDRTYYKCELWYLSNSEATDIRLKNTTCNKYEEKKE